MTGVGVSVLGAVGALLSSTMFLPQVYRVLRTSKRDQVAISVSSQALILLNAVIWLSYSITSGALWAGVPSRINIPVIGIILTRAVLARHRDRYHRD